jgi:hypothetical protein
MPTARQISCGLGSDPDPVMIDIKALRRDFNNLCAAFHIKHNEGLRIFWKQTQTEMSLEIKERFMERVLVLKEMGWDPSRHHHL